MTIFNVYNPRYGNASVGRPGSKASEHSHKTEDIIKKQTQKANSKNEILNDTINQIVEGFEEKLEKNDVNLNKQLKIEAGLTKLQTVTNSLTAAMKAVNTVASSPVKAMAAAGVPAGVTIQASSAANTGSHTIAVDSIASKQRYIIQSKDVNGKAVPFLSNPATDVSAYQQGYGFEQGSTLRITYDSVGSRIMADILIPNTALTLQDVADVINIQLQIAAGAGSPTVKAYPVYDNVGGSLIIESINPGEAYNFYLSDEIAFNTLDGISILEQPEVVKSIDLYNKNGLPFSTKNALNTAERLVPFLWAIAPNRVISFNEDEVQNLTQMAIRINSEGRFTGGIKAEIVEEIGGGYILRVKGNMDFSLASLYDGYKDGAGNSTLTSKCARVSTSCDTMVKIDGIPYNLAGSTDITNPTADIAAISVTAPTENTTFSIAENTDVMKNSIKSFVDSVNSVQQFIAQQKPKEGGRSDFQGSLNELSNMIRNLTYAVGTKSLSGIVVDWFEYIPSASEEATGAVAAKYLRINEDKLTEALKTDMAGVKSLFSGAKSATVTPYNPGLPGHNVAITLNALGSTPSTFKLNVIKDAFNNMKAYATDYGGGGQIDFNIAEVGLIAPGEFTITGTGPFAGLNLTYKRSPPASFVGNTVETSTITLAPPGMISSLLAGMPSFLTSISGRLKQAGNYKKKWQTERVKIEKDLEGKIRKAQVEAEMLKRQETQAKESQKIMQRMWFGNYKD